MSTHLLITLSVQDRVCRIVDIFLYNLLSCWNFATSFPGPERISTSFIIATVYTQMPYLPDGSFARGEQWFAKRGRPKNHTEAQWVEGFLGIEFL